jgi:hypothetical protein
VRSPFKFALFVSALTICERGRGTTHLASLSFHFLGISTHSFATGGEDGYIRLNHFDADFSKVLATGDEDKHSKE